MDSGVISSIEKDSEARTEDYNLPVDFEKTSSVSLDSIPELSNLANKIKVFLKIRPTDLKNEDEIFTIVNSTNLVTKIPTIDASSSSSSSIRQSKHLNNKDSSRKYKFTQILPLGISQSQLFHDIAKENVTNFIHGQNSTLMNYGTSNSGKTYSLFGTNDCLGLIPRSLKCLFSNIENNVSTLYKPSNGNVVKNFDEFERILDSQAKEKLFIGRKMKNVDNFLKLDDVSLKEVDDDDYFYSVWISFFEIYNECIFDLLTTSEEGKNVQLKLVTDEKGNNYLKGVRKVFAATADEAFQIMMAGKSRLRVASTTVNLKSSRSHAIFSVTLLKYRDNSSHEDVQVSTLTFCDLAGSGGLRMNQNSERIKESRSINASLLVLGRCLKTIQRNSILRNNTGPFRESNLTRYLQNALSGKENLIILVNLNKSPELYVETQNVLNFVSTLNKMTLEILPNPKKSLISRSSTWISSPKHSSCNTPSKITLDTSNSTKEMENYEKLKQENDKLLQELTTLKNCVLNKEYEIRQELTELYSTKMKDLEKDWRKKTDKLDEEHDDLLKWSVKQVEDYYKERINNMTNRKRKRLNNHEGHGDSEDSTIENLEEENSKATSKIIALREVVENLKKKNLELSVQKSELTFELSITKKELDSFKIKSQNESIDENAFSTRRESFLFEFTEHWTRTNELQDELNEKKEQIDQLQAQLEKKDQELLEIRKNFKENFDVKIDKSNSQVSLSPISMNKISIIEEENLETPRVSLRTLVTVPILESLNLSEENRLSFLDSSIEKSEKSIRTSDDDSGIRTSSGTSEFNKIENDDKSIQVDLNVNENIDEIKLKLESLRLEYETLANNYSTKSQKLDDYMQEIEELKNCISQLETRSIADQKKLKETESLLASKDADLKRLDFEKKELDAKHKAMFENWREKIVNYEKTFEANFTDISMPDDLEKYIEKCVTLGNQIKIDQAQLEQKVLKCSTEHVPKIRKLEQLLMEKNLIVHNLNEEMSEVEIDLRRIEQIDGKMKNFEIALQRNEKEKEHLRKLLQERISQQRELETKLTNLSEKITRRDSELLILKENLNHTKTTNSNNYKNTNELSNLVSESLLKMSDMKSELSKFEDARNNMDRSWAQEYGFLKSQLSIFENQGHLLSLMYERNDDIMADATKLKKDLHLKDREIQEIKKNRDETIQRYDILVDQLQMDVNVIKENKEYLALQESNKQLKKSISETFKFKKRKSKSRQLNTKEDSKIWNSQTFSSSASLESIRKFARRSCQCHKTSEVESESILNIISSKLSGFYNNIESQSGTTLIRIVDNRNSLKEKKLFF